MISSGVVPAGAAFSSGPSWARAGKAASAHASSGRQSKRPDTDFIMSKFIGWRGAFVERLPATSAARPGGRGSHHDEASGEETQQATTLRKHTAAAHPSNPSPLSEAGGKGAAVLP